MPKSPSLEESIFAAALDKGSPQERAAYLDAVCGNDGALRARIENLLKSHDQAGSFLRKPLPATVDEAPRERPGTIIGAYKLLQQIGEGGMGVVYMAEQEQPVRRRVALKIIKPGMDSHQVIARFEAERQALAMMDHPNIAKVFEAGTTETGRPYFVMELVHGVPITSYCDENKLTPRERLELFVPVCQAIQHAHQKGIIHRDVKPSNVLVTMYDDRAVPKVIDFGVAKAVEQRLTDKSLFTQFGTMVGTFEYMSPEQAEMNAFGVDTRSDVYSLGVLLYELLTGTTPLERPRLREAALNELLRLIKEEEPPRPSVRLSSSGTLAKVAAARKMEPAQLSKLVRGELDWIVMRALEKNRSRRYESAGGMARDVERYLRDEPVKACPPSLGYRLRKFGRKHKKALVTAGLFALLLVVGVVMSAVQAVRAMQAERLARQQQMMAEDAAHQAKESTGVAKSERDRATTATDDLRRALYDVEMSLMQPAWEADNLARFDQLLDKQRPRPGMPDVRAFEWYYWDRLRHAELRSVKVADGYPLSAVPALSPDGSRLAAVVVENGRGAVRIWDTNTGRVERTLVDGLDYRSGRPWIGFRAQFSADGGRVAVSLLRLNYADDDAIRFGAVAPGDWNGDLQVGVWEVVRGKKLLDVTMKTMPVGYDSPALGREGKLLAFHTYERTDRKQQGRIHIWDVDQNKELSTLTPSLTAIGSLAFSPDGRHLAAAMACVLLSDDVPGLRAVDEDYELHVFAVDTGKDQLTIRFRDGGAVFSPDGKVLAVVRQGAKGSLLTLYNATDGKELRTIDSVTGSRPAFSPDGRRITCDAVGPVVRVWDTGSGEVVYTVRGHESTPTVVLTEGDHLRTAGLDGTVKEWGPPPEQPGPEGVEAKGGCSPVAWAFGKTFTRLARAFQGADNRTLVVRVWDGDHGKSRVLTEVKTDRPISRMQDLMFSDDGRRLAATIWAPPVSRLKVWDADSGQELFSPPEVPFYPTAMAISPDGSRIAQARNMRVTVWDVAMKREVIDVEGPLPLISKVVFSPDGRRLAWVGAAGVRVWDLAAAREMVLLSTPGGRPGPLAFSPDGQRLAAAVGPMREMFTEIKVWDTTTGKELLSLKGEKQVEDVAFSPDGRRLATLGAGSQEGGHEVKVWDAVGGVLLLRLPCRRADGYPYRVLQFHPDGKRLFLMRMQPDRPGASGLREVWDGTPLPDDRQQGPRGR